MNVFRVAAWPLFTITPVEVEEDVSLCEWLRDDYGDYYMFVTERYAANKILKSCLDAQYQSQANPLAQ